MAVARLKIDREQGVFSRVDDEILQDILGRLPGVEFSSAAGVNTNWNKNCGQMLSRPNSPTCKFKFFFFLINCYGINEQITEKIGSGVPIITNRAMGLIGTDVETHNLNEACS